MAHPRARRLAGWAILGALALVLSVLPNGSVDAQATGESEGTEATTVEVIQQLPATSEDRPGREPFTDAEIARLEAATRGTHLPGPPVPESSAQIVGPEPGTESTVTELPQANGTFTFFRLRRIMAGGTTGKSDVAEVSVAGAGRILFATWNWGAAISTNGGITWTYQDPSSGFGDFCCDQVVQYDPARNLLIWLRQSSHNGSTNQYRISTTANGGSTWRHWNVTSPTGQWYDYPHIGLTNDFMYVSYNVFTTAGNSWVNTQVRRMSLDGLRDGGALDQRIHTNATHFNATPVQGATDSMFWATHVSTSRMRIHEWSDDSTTVFWYERDVPAWTSTGRGDMACVDVPGDDWAERGGDRVLSGVRTNGELTWFWNVQEGSGFDKPYTNAATFDEDTKNYLRRPFIWNSNFCALYTAAHVNARGHIGLALNWGNDLPHLVVSLDDDYNGQPPGWELKYVRTSSERPPNEWGDYNTVRPNYPGGINFIAGGHVRHSTSDDQTQIWFVVFGRERDRLSWVRWAGK